MNFRSADALLGALFLPLHGGGSLHYALAPKSGTGGTRSAAGSSSGFHSWTWTSVSSVSASPSRFCGAGATSSTDSLDTLSNQPEGCVVAAATTSSEEEQLQAPTDRFVGYIDKERQLEAHNRSLEGEAAALQQQQVGREVHETRGAMLRLGSCEHLLEDITHVCQRLDNEVWQREEAEAAARALTRCTQEAEAARVELQKVQALQEECGYLSRHYQEEQVVELLGRCRLSCATPSSATEIGSACIRGVVLSEAGLTLEAAKVNIDAMCSASEEITEYWRQLQARTTELEALKSTKDSLERQRSELEDRHQANIASYEEVIQQLDAELRTTKWEMIMALDIEIAAYRKLLEGEECRTSFGPIPFSLPEGLPKIPSVSTHIKVKSEEKIKVMEETQVTEEVTEEEEKEAREEEGKEEEEEEAKSPPTEEATSPEKEAKSPVNEEAKSPEKEEAKSPAEVKFPEKAKSLAKEKAKSSAEAKSPEKAKSSVKEEAKSPAEVKSPEKA
uniref:IF rod domain-containing protein n=1 Tax=Pan troglodytes TaxID=9598 RepID=A0A2I3T570_PANTR